MKLKLKVLRPFKDKNNLKIGYEVGGELSISADTPENVARINDLIARGLCEIAAAEPRPLRLLRPTRMTRLPLRRCRSTGRNIRSLR